MASRLLIATVATLGLIAPSALAQTTLTPSGPIRVTTAGQIVENRRITAPAGQVGLSIEAPDVTVRNVEVLHTSGGQPGIKILNADRARLENVAVEYTGALITGVANENNIFVYSSDDVVFDHVRVRRGAAGAFFLQSLRAQVHFLEGHDFRGPAPRGELIQFDNSHNCLVEDFSAENAIDPNVARPEDVISAYQTNGCIFRRGLLDGNNSTNGQQLIFEFTTSGLVEDVDVVRSFSGGFGAYPGSNVTFRRTRARDNNCTDLGRGPPSSDGIVWNASTQPLSQNVRIEASQYFHLCTNPMYPRASTSPPWAAVQLTQADFTPRAPIRIAFPWEGGEPPPPPPPPPPGDTTPPTVDITSPSGTTVSRNTTITIRANDSDNVGVRDVRFRIVETNNVLKTDNTSPYSVNWRTPTSRNVTRTIEARARDAAGNATLDTVRVTTR